MIDERVLADPGRCPACAALLGTSPDACPACGLRLSGPTASQLWRVSQRTAELLTERDRLLAVLRAEGARVQPTGTGSPVPPAPPLPPRLPAAPRAEWTPRRVQNLLLALGVGLLGVAAVIFVVVSWGQLGVGGRAAVMTGVTALAVAGAVVAARRGLSASAEALSLLAVGLALLDCAGAWASDLFGLRSVDGPYAAAGSAALVAIAAGAGSSTLRTRSLRLSAAVLAQLALPLAVTHLADSVDQPFALVAAAAAAQAIAALAVATAWPWGRGTRDARLTVGIGALLAGLVAVVLALVAAYGEQGSLVIGTALLLVAAGAISVAAELARGRRSLTAAASSTLRAVAAAVVVAAVWAPVVELSADRWLAPLLAATAAALLFLIVLVPVDRRRAPAVVALAAAWLPALAAAPTLVTAAAGRVRWLDAAWTGQPGPARDLLAGADLESFGEEAMRWGPTATLLLVVAAAGALATLVDARLRLATWAVIPALAAAGLLAVPAIDGAYAMGLTVDLLLALILLAGAVALTRSGRTGTTALTMTSAASGTVVLGLAVAWAFAVETATLAALPVAAAVLAGPVALGHGIARLRTTRVVAATLAVLLLVGESAALARHGSAGWPAVTSVALSLLVVAALGALAAAVLRASATDPFWTVVRELLALVAVGAALADVAALTWWRGAGSGGIGLAVCVAAGVLLAASTLEVPERGVTSRSGLIAVTAVAATVGLTAAAADGDRLWVALLALGVGVAVQGIRLDHRAGWLSGLLLAASSWVRLAMSEVTAPEAYTVGPALALLAVGWFRRRRDAAYPSWKAYGAGLTLGLGPSLLRAVTDAGDLRPLLLGLAALAVLAVGVVRRLQAPLVLGGGVLAVDALVQLAPYLAAAYEVVPRWATIGVIGLLLLGAGVTYEQRVGDLRRVGQRIGRLG